MGRFFGGAGAAGPELELGGAGTFAPLPVPSRKGRVFGGLFFVLAAVCVGIAAYNIAHTAGLAGRPGTVTVERCWTEHGSGRSSDKVVCSGTFRPDDGTRAVPDAVVPRALKAGQEIAVQQTGRGYLPSGAGETARWIALFFFAWIVAALGIPFAATGIFPGRGQAAAVGASIRGTGAARVLKYMMAGGAGGAAVSLYVTWVL
jgi:hypothetical protein